MTKSASPTPRMPLQPLLDYVYSRHQVDSEFVHPIGDRKLTDCEVSRFLGLQPRAVSSWRAHNGIPYYTADSVAIRLGIHPLLLWPDFHQQTILN